MKSILTTLLLSLCFVFTEPVLAQYEGQIDYRIYNPQKLDEGVNHLSLSITQDRLFVHSTSSSMNVMGGLNTNGVLVRNDLQDFVFMTGQNEAFQIDKEELDGIISMIRRFQGNGDSAQSAGFNWSERVEETGSTQTIRGYTTSELVLKGEEEGEEISVWLTEQIKVNWGLLLDAWYEIGAPEVGADIPIELVMNRNSFPLLVEARKDAETVFRAETTAIHENVDRSSLEVPPGIKLMGIADVMMNLFRNQ